MDLCFNLTAAFTRWVVASGALHEPFVVVDVGVQGGENPRWHLLGDHLVVHGLDAIREVVEALRQQNEGNPKRHYHWVAAGSADEEREFYFNAADPTSSSFYAHGSDRFATERRDQPRRVPMRRLDTLLRDGVVAPPDFLKIDVEGFEKDVFLGAPQLLRSVLGIEAETNFSISPSYPNGHFAALHEMLLARRFLVFDLNFNRIPRASFQQALKRKGLEPVLDQESVGKPATVNVLFCRDPIDELDRPVVYAAPYEALSVDQLIKLMIIYELHGLNDIAVDTIERFKDLLVARLDPDKAVDLLADRYCRRPGGPPPEPVPVKVSPWRAIYLGVAQRCVDFEQASGWQIGAPLRALRRAWSRSS